MGAHLLPPPDFTAAVGGHPLVAEILWRRGCATAAAARAFLDPDQYSPAPAACLPGLEDAARRLLAAISAGERIHVWGDFDVDGQTSASVLVLGLRARGAVVDYTIPNRAAHSHGLNQPGIDRAREEGARVLLTCDCGVTDFDDIAFARRLGLDVIISDHHDLDPSGRLPDALAVVNPRRLPADHPLADLPGVGVAFKLIEGLALLSGLSPDAQASALQPLLDLVALGIVADVATQRGDTRYLLQRGLAQLRRAPRLGLRALLDKAGIDSAALDAEDIGYQIGPRLNAVGRLDHAELCVELLTTEDAGSAAELATRIEALNEQRKTLQRAVEDSALEHIAADPAALRHPVVVLDSPDWHPSVLGVVGSTIAGRYGKPAILISARPGQIGRGSARSVPGVDIHAAIVAQGGLVETSGGHPMAAGFGIRHENIAAFRDGIGAWVSQRAQAGAEMAGAIEPDGIVAWRDVSLALCDQLERLAPFGPGNPRPVLKSERLKVTRSETLGKDARHLALHLSDADGHIAKAVWWRAGSPPAPDEARDLWYTLHRRVYRGRASMQVHVTLLTPAASSSAGDAATAPRVSARFSITDLRGALDRTQTLRQLVAQHGPAGIQVWSESPDAAPDAAPEAAPVARGQLAPAPVLVIWTAPPGPEVLAQALERAAPQAVVLLTAPDAPDRDGAAAFLQQLAGMLKVSQRRGDAPDDPEVVARMAARVGQREDTIRAGLACLRPAQSDEDRMDADQARRRLAYWLEETRAYRRYFQAAQAEAVLRGERA